MKPTKEPRQRAIPDPVDGPEISEDAEGDVMITWETQLGQQVVFVPREAKLELLDWLVLDLAASASLHPIEVEMLKGVHGWLSERLAPKKARAH